MQQLLPAPLRPYGNLKFLTYQCLCIQLLNAILHVGAHFSRSLEKPRDLVFSTLAYPIGSIVVYTFWLVWHVMGRELIFPTELSQYYPDWLNHATHTIIAPLNLLMAVLVNHKYNRSGVILTIAFFAFYTGFLHVIKLRTGLFVYKYLETFSELQRLIYFAGTGFIAYTMYKSGQLLTNLVHKKSAAQEKPLKAKSKQK